MPKRVRPPYCWNAYLVVHMAFIASALAWRVFSEIDADMSITELLEAFVGLSVLLQLVFLVFPVATTIFLLLVWNTSWWNRAKGIADCFGCVLHVWAVLPGYQ